MRSVGGAPSSGSFWMNSVSAGAELQTSSVSWPSRRMLSDGTRAAIARFELVKSVVSCAEASAGASSAASVATAVQCRCGFVPDMRSDTSPSAQSLGAADRSDPSPPFEGTTVSRVRLARTSPCEPAYPTLRTFRATARRLATRRQIGVNKSKGVDGIAGLKPCATETFRCRHPSAVAQPLRVAIRHRWVFALKR